MWLLEISKFTKHCELEVVGLYKFSDFKNAIDYIEKELEGKCYDTYPLYWTVRYKGKYRLASIQYIK